MKKVKIPDGALCILNTLQAEGYEAFIVGGCVRDMLLGTEPHDWDICTSALPMEVKESLSQYRTLDTGLKHGTVTVLMQDGGYEVTTFRVDGSYSDGRHPDSVTFTRSIEEDLSRRDFTINAMALDASGEHLIDPYHGREGLRLGVIRCVGDAAQRFQEDALRILRALRFASRLDYHIDYATQNAMRDNRGLLSQISRERIWDELSKILMTDSGWDYLHTFSDILLEFIPEFKDCIGLDQMNAWHRYNVFDHIIMSVAYAPQDLVIRTTMLLHDIGKPASMTVGEDGRGHFYGHQDISAQQAEAILRRLKCSNQFTHDVVELVKYHDMPIAPTAKAVRRALNLLGPEQLTRLFLVKRADTMAQSEMAQRNKLGEIAACEEVLAKVLSDQQAFSLKDLAISGKDLIAAGMAQGKGIGDALNLALEAVLDGTAANDKETLLAIALERRL